MAKHRHAWGRKAERSPLVAAVHAYEGPASTTFLARTVDGALTWQRLPLNEQLPVTLPSGCRIISTVLGTNQVEWRIDCTTFAP